MKTRTAALKPFQTRSLVDRTVEALRRLILDDRFGPSGLLPSQRELGEQLGISRSVIREAMKILESQGLVDVSQGKRPRIKPVGCQTVIESLQTYLQRSDASLLQLVEARRPLESHIAGLAAERATSEDLARLAGTIDEMKKSRSLERQMDADVRFHRHLAQATGNPIFEVLLETLGQLLLESRRKTISRSGVELAIDHHERILAAVEQRDADLARAEMLHHLDMAKEDIEDVEGA